jgi:hypothetical protein
MAEKIGDSGPYPLFRRGWIFGLEGVTQTRPISTRLSNQSTHGVTVPVQAGIPKPRKTEVKEKTLPFFKEGKCAEKIGSNVNRSLVSIAFFPHSVWAKTAWSSATPKLAAFVVSA